MLLSSDNKVKLCDFSVAQIFEDGEELLSTSAGSPAFLAPGAFPVGFLRKNREKKNPYVLLFRAHLEPRIRAWVRIGCLVSGSHVVLFPFWARAFCWGVCSANL